jgi:hypothetical protein
VTALTKMAGTEKRRSTEQRNTVTMGVAATRTLLLTGGNSGPRSLRQAALSRIEGWSVDARTCELTFL